MPIISDLPFIHMNYDVSTAILGRSAYKLGYILYSIEVANNQWPVIYMYYQSPLTSHLPAPFYKISAAFFWVTKQLRDCKIDFVRMNGYADFTTSTIESVTELKPGDHIRVPGTGWQKLHQFQSD